MVSYILLVVVSISSSSATKQAHLIKVRTFALACDYEWLVRVCNVSPGEFSGTVPVGWEWYVFTGSNGTHWSEVLILRPIFPFSYSLYPQKKFRSWFFYKSNNLT